MTKTHVRIIWGGSIHRRVVVKSYEPTVAHYFRSLSRFSYYKATNSIATPPGWDASPSQVASKHFVRFPCQFAGTYLYPWVERAIARIKCLAQENNTITRPGLEPGPLESESSALTTWPPHLPPVIVPVRCFVYRLNVVWKNARK